MNEHKSVPHISLTTLDWKSEIKDDASVKVGAQKMAHRFRIPIVRTRYVMTPRSNYGQRKTERN